MKSDSQSSFKPFKILGILLCSMVLLAFAFWPQLPTHSHKVGTAYTKYLHTPSEENKRSYEAAIDKANRGLHALQYGAAICGLGLPLLLLFFYPERSEGSL